MMHYHVGDAVEVLGRMQGPFDLIFSDIDKQQYPSSLAVIAEKLRPGGVLLADNLLWYGRIFNAVDHDPSTQAVRQFSLAVLRDPAWNASIVPIGDGILLAINN